MGSKMNTITIERRLDRVVARDRSMIEVPALDLDLICLFAEGERRAAVAARDAAFAEIETEWQIADAVDGRR